MKTGTKVACLVLALFALMACAWTAMFHFAAQADTRTVPLATARPAQEAR